MNDFMSLMGLIDSYFGSAQWFVFFLLGTGIFFTIYLKFPQIRYFKESIRILSGKKGGGHDASLSGDTSHFQALTSALSGTVGTGNIAGVALAIHIGGPSALFWMTLTAFFGMTTKMVEVSLSHKYRSKSSDGTIVGGPMSYMSKGLNMKWLAVIFSVATIFSSFGTGSLPQINNISTVVYTTLHVPTYITGIIVAILVGLIVIGGIKRIAMLTEKLVPFMVVIYIIGAVAVLIHNSGNVVPAFISIFSNIFSGSSAMGGFLGASFAWAFSNGVGRGLFSNEAGQGSAAIAHASAKADNPISEGLVALLEPFLDTIIVCFITGMVLLSSGAWNSKYDNKFQQAETVVFANAYDESDPAQKQQVADFLAGTENLPLFTGDLQIVDGKLQNDLTIMHSRSFAEDIYIRKGDEPYTGAVNVKDGVINASHFYGRDMLEIRGKSLLHSASLSSVAFQSSAFGVWGKFIVMFSLILFAFSTTVVWAYYGDRAVVYLVGEKWVIPYKVIYLISIFIASFTDTTVVWAVTSITCALMTFPNLVGILLLRKDMKSELKLYDECNYKK